MRRPSRKCGGSCASTDSPSPAAGRDLATGAARGSAHSSSPAAPRISPSVGGLLVKAVSSVDTLLVMAEESSRRYRRRATVCWSVHHHPRTIQLQRSSFHSGPKLKRDRCCNDVRGWRGIIAPHFGISRRGGVAQPATAMPHEFTLSHRVEFSESGACRLLLAFMRRLAGLDSFVTMPLDIPAPEAPVCGSSMRHRQTVHTRWIQHPQAA